MARLADDRVIAGRRYADAAAELRKCFVELAAIDQALAASRRSPSADAQTFAAFPDPAVFQHPVFLPTFDADWQAEAVARRDQLVGRLNC
jgi:hypothetical protein